MVYMLTGLGYIDGIHVTIYGSTMDQSWVMNRHCDTNPLDLRRYDIAGGCLATDDTPSRYLT